MNTTPIHVIKRDGSRVPYDGAEIAASIASAARGLPDATVRGTQLRSELEIILFDGITSTELDRAVIHVALQNVAEDPDHDTIASRLLVKTMYKDVFGDTRDLLGEDDPEVIRGKHREFFAGYIERGVRLGLLDARLADRFDLDRLALALAPERDDLLRYIGVQTLRTRYALEEPGPERRVLETPQFFWMRVAMGLALNEEDPTTAALSFYEAMSTLKYLAAGSTLVNAGTAHAQLSNCFVMQMDDDIEHIAKTVRDVMWLTKGTGGIGLSVSKLRCEGSPIRSNNTASTGPVPFMHTIDSTLRAVSRGGKKFGALCFYMENWHLDIDQFLDLRQNSGDPYRRTRTANTALWISDEFMKRVDADEPWYLFDPLEVPDLVELTGAAFSRRYAEYVARAEAGELRHRRVRARELWQAICIALQTTSHPWLTWKDTINTRALNDNTGTIHSSNLCTEITLPQDRDNVAVCNLASVNLSRHVTGRARAGGVTIDWDGLAATTRLAVRQLDNLIDITNSRVPEAEHSNVQNRALGLGVMGFTDVVERCGWSYDSDEALDLIDELVEFISWHAIDASCDLAVERGAYPEFAGSGWSRGRVPIDTLDDLAADRGHSIDVDRTTRLDWDALRTRVAQGIRNSTLMAIAPTASIGLVAGTTPGLDPQFSQLFSRATSSGKFLEVNRNLVADLRDLDLWESVRGGLLRAQGDLSQVAGVPEEIRRVYRTSFQLPGRAFMRVAARAQKWIDQAISRNVYLADRDLGAMQELYLDAWRMGVKTTYYLHMQPRHTAEQSTVAVNKAAARSGAGFGAARAGGTRPTGFGAAPSVVPAGFGAATRRPNLLTVDTEIADACPTDPAERLQCDSCQ